MNNRVRAAISVLIAAVVIGAFGQAIVVGQTRTAEKSSAVPRTPDGHPDLQGTYDIATMTPLQRPAAFSGRLILSDDEAAALEKAEEIRTQQDAQSSRPDREAPPAGKELTGASVALVGPLGGPVGNQGYNEFWKARGSTIISVDGKKRSSLVVDPPDGRIPALTPEAQKRISVRADESANTGSPDVPSDPEQLSQADRCLLGFDMSTIPPTLPNYFYNNLKQIVQTPGYVMILNEMIHEARIIRIGGTHPPQHIRRWVGDSVGRWEGDTLVVDSTNFSDKTMFRGSSAEKVHVVERFTRVDANTLLYKFTVDDPKTFMKPWSGEYPWPETEDHLYEYACHEGNYAMGGILRGARLHDKEDAESNGSRKEIKNKQ